VQCPAMLCSALRRGHLLEKDARHAYARCSVLTSCKAE
jgi:hypothetical protein